MKRTISVAFILLLAVCVVIGFWIGYIYTGEDANAAVVEAAPVIVEEVVEEVVEETPLPSYTAEDLETLAIIIYQEAGSDATPDEVREYVGCVVLNRVESDRFQDTIQEVATAKRQWGRLYWTGIVWPERAASPNEAHAVERARECAKRVLEMDERPVPKNVVWCAEFPQGEGTWKEFDGFYFCY